ncbi:solute carrier family 35 member G1-like [Oculina patagonica]
MAAKIFSPLIARLRRRNDISLPQEGDGDFTERNSTEPTTEKSHFNTGITRTANNHAIELQDGLDSERVNNTTELIVATKMKTSTRKRVAFLHRFLGIILAIIASLVVSVTALMVKLAETIPSLEVTVIRLTIQLVFSLPSMVFFQDKFIYPWKHSKYLLLRGVTGATAMTLSIYAVKHMPLADARVIIYTSPVFTAILGRIFLKEPVSKFDVIAMVLSIGGVVLIGRPTFLFGSLGTSTSSKQAWVPTLVAVCAAIVTAFSIILTRKMSQEVGTRVVVFYFALVGSIISLAGSLISGFKFPDCGTHDTIFALAAGVLGYSGELIATKALAMDKASIITLVRTTGIAFSFILQLIVLDVIPNGLSIGGAILVLLCNVAIFTKKFLDTKKRNLEE